MGKKIVIVTKNKYPLGDAGALRQHATAKIFQKLGWKVFIIGDGDSTDQRIKEFDGIKYTSLRTNKTDKLSRVIEHLSFGRQVINIIKQSEDKPDIILVVDVLPDAFYRISHYAIQNNIKLIHDSVEWYSPEEFKTRRFNKDYILKEYTNGYAINNKWSVIAISTYLNAYFKKKGCETTRIPVIMDIETMQSNFELHNNKISIVYAGGPGRKDYLSEIIEGISKLSSVDKEQIEFHIIGVNKEQLIRICGVDSSLLQSNKMIYTHGRVSHTEAVKWVREADFTILLRDETLRYAQAGFPTKIVESLACGTPVICNYSSDLQMYLKNEENSIKIDGHTSQAVSETLHRAIQLGKEKIKEMRIPARETALKYFDYRLYIKQMGDFIFAIENTAGGGK